MTGRPTIPENAVRKARGVGFSDAEYAAVTERATELGVPIAVYIRWMCKMPIAPKWAAVLAGRRR